MPKGEPALAVAPVTLGSVLRQATADLKQAGVANAGDDARRLLGWVLGLSAAQMLGRPPDRPLGSGECERFSRCIARRREREPVSRIVGQRDFYGRAFAISPATLDPRPDSETLIEATLEFVRREDWLTRPLRILDVGTGSGCLLLTLLCELPNAIGVGTDISEAALATARDNARSLGVEARVDWLLRDALEGIDGQFDLMVSNPPYVRSNDITRLEPEVRCFEPLAALDGGGDGLVIYRRLTKKIRDVVPRGWIILEVGHDQADAVADLLVSGAPEGRYENVEFRMDVARKRRCVAARSRN